jgi:cytochrome bd-type quinol oxidase subunit 1
MTGAIFVIGISSWYLLKKRETRFALASIRVAACVGIVGTLILMWSGDGSGVHAAKYQPMKLAAAEGLEKGRVEGEICKQLEIAYNLKQAGIPTEQIALFTGLSIEEVKTLS